MHPPRGHCELMRAQGSQASLYEPQAFRAPHLAAAHRGHTKFAAPASGREAEMLTSRCRKCHAQRLRPTSSPKPCNDKKRWSARRSKRNNCSELIADEGGFTINGMF